MQIVNMMLTWLLHMSKADGMRMFPIQVVMELLVVVHFQTVGNAWEVLLKGV
jgi:hypothetical protein